MKNKVIGFAALTASACLVAALGCASGKPDPRCRIDAGGHNTQIAKFVGKSKLWRTYFDKMTGTAALVEIKVDVERYRQKSYGGDYDPGTVTFVFEARSLKHKRRLFEEEGKFEVDSFLIGRFDNNASREEMQETAFRDAEKEAYPFLDRWVNMTAIKAMGLEGKQGTMFVPTLEKLLEDRWTTGDLKGATREALARIQGSA